MLSFKTALPKALALSKASITEAALVIAETGASREQLVSYVEAAYKTEATRAKYRGLIEKVYTFSPEVEEPEAEVENVGAEAEPPRVTYRGTKHPDAVKAEAEAASVAVAKVETVEVVFPLSGVHELPALSREFLDAYKSEEEELVTKTIERLLSMHNGKFLSASAHWSNAGSSSAMASVRCAADAWIRQSRMVASGIKIPPLVSKVERAEARHVSVKEYLHAHDSTRPVVAGYGGESSTRPFDQVLATMMANDGWYKDRDYLSKTDKGVLLSIYGLGESLAPALTKGWEPVAALAAGSRLMLTCSGLHAPNKVENDIRRYLFSLLAKDERSEGGLYRAIRKGLGRILRHGAGLAFAEVSFRRRAEELAVEARHGVGISDLSMDGLNAEQRQAVLAAFARQGDGTFVRGDDAPLADDDVSSLIEAVGYAQSMFSAILEPVQVAIQRGRDPRTVPLIWVPIPVRESGLFLEVSTKAEPHFVAFGDEVLSRDTNFRGNKPEEGDSFYRGLMGYEMARSLARATADREASCEAAKAIKGHMADLKKIGRLPSDLQKALGVAVPAAVETVLGPDKAEDRESEIEDLFKDLRVGLEDLDAEVGGFGFFNTDDLS